MDLATPFERFLKQQVSSSWLLFGATIAALIWANSPWGHSYEELWHMMVGIDAGQFSMIKPLHLWINDGLMAVFFFVIGLEIKREIVSGELSDPGKALLPIVAAIGGMVLPVGLFLLFNPETGANNGWGIPMATDIAFSLGILQLLGKRVPIGLKVFLTAFAIVDDLGAVAVIAVFYSHGLQTSLLLGAAAILSGLSFLSWRGFYNKYFYFLCAVVVWMLFLKGGLHPTLAGVLMAFTIPIRRAVNLPGFLEHIHNALGRLSESRQPSSHKTILTKQQLSALDDIEVHTGEVLSPLQHLEHKLHGYVGYLIMPLFALANAGVPFSLGGGIHNGLILALAGSMVLGKFLGIFTFSAAAVKLGWCRLPEGVSNRHLLGAAFLGGLGFTMALFIAGLAYDQSDVLAASKLGILIGSLVAGLGGYAILRGSAEVSPVQADHPYLPLRPSKSNKTGKESQPSDADSDDDSKKSGGLAIGKTVYPKSAD